MKKLIMFMMTLVVITTSFIGLQNLTNKKIKNSSSQQFQLQLAIVNNTQDVNGRKFTNWENKDIVWFYFDIAIDDITYGDNEFVSQNINNYNFNSNFHSGFGTTNINNYPDIFWTNLNTEVILYTFNLDPKRTGAIINFTFGIFYNPYHYQNICVNNYLYNFYKTYYDTKNNGTRLTIYANGGWGSNTADWEFEYYKF